MMANSAFDSIPPEPDDAVVDQAILWLTQLSSGLASEEERRAYRDWCAQHPQNALAAHRLEGIFLRFDGLPAEPARAALESQRRPRRKALKLALSLALLLAGGGLLSPWPQARYWTADYRTAAGERRVVELADHSTLTLNSGSAVNIRYDGHARRVDLLAGEVLVQVAHISDAASRPFAVHTGDGEARALGTRYLVRREPGATVVTVLESAVRAGSADGNASRTVLPDQRVRISANAVSAPQAVDAGQAASWVRGRLVADNAPLSEVLAELAPYRRGLLRYDADNMGTLRVSGVFALDDGDRTLATLQALLPITVEHYTPFLTVVSVKTKK
ncbi:FecR family protein [Janthinobacterium sp. Mn2066]|uniref:FecR family protein n=1 Tax=Janthinobacterium sp. Mn2066 TaxID=3395264 RepID=UPI003BD6BC18